MVTGLTEISIESKEQVRTPTTASDGDGASAVVDAAAVVIAMIVMFMFSPKISSFIHKHPTLKMLALSILVMIGLSLVIEGWNSEAAHQLALKNYIYFGMAFSFLVEMLNMYMRKKQKRSSHPVQLHERYYRQNQSNDPDSAH